MADGDPLCKKCAQPKSKHYHCGGYTHAHCMTPGEANASGELFEPVRPGADWPATIAKQIACGKMLDGKPEELKCGTWLHPGSILNAYREGDLTFDKAVQQLEIWRGTPAKEK